MNDTNVLTFYGGLISDNTAITFRNEELYFSDVLTPFILVCSILCWLYHVTTSHLSCNTEIVGSRKSAHLVVTSNFSHYPPCESTVSAAPGGARKAPKLPDRRKGLNRDPDYFLMISLVALLDSDFSCVSTALLITVFDLQVNALLVWNPWRRSSAKSRARRAFISRWPPSRKLTCWRAFLRPCCRSWIL